METERRRAFRMFPIEAAVMPLPREETTPPVTKTYFDIDDLQGGFMDSTGERMRGNPDRFLYARAGRELNLCRASQRVIVRTIWGFEPREVSIVRTNAGWGHAGGLCLQAWVFGST